ncbi:thioether cross-link-forming SCIFF peptide maturase [Clostridium gasigenes]|uniref:Thioether cross-link-forming SCIFF peptide maturase n=1 Tax=Clostridium gasigenes TaxID=94869 RepID=A0A1H0S7C1_9CLOT|nr:thioether cross-link-forming SCIFF peptide maturase [Clostridium gasigenes]MBB6714336.1 thioether cross-link-forming SCIFF peptide maturase [Clostridium gasigenes]MBU3103731.1 thioether cross-link-forming SCIFF peptide maturase [Clostridium gasigenes]MBU3132929.1 thioether cross-link-forming SCIFF peptide maturase [Clostridium gasigenes]NKF06264.1 thioether cross-link-forming SCIFF peptide maturase [Clostridium gasigenes]QSW20153.1 thioether cross-link-forming SCIFF peptide maturase [Clostr
MASIHKFKQGENFFVLDVSTGAVHIVDELVYDLVNEEKMESKEELINKFGNKYGEVIISEAYDEIMELVSENILYSTDNYEEIAHSSMDDRDYIKAVCLNIIHGCNLRCKYCFAEDGEYHGNKGIMSLETAKQAIDYVVKRSGPRRNLEIDLFGGEPTMIMGTIKEIIKYARENEKAWKKNIRFTMTTNATLLNDDMMDFMDKEMGNIILSLDGRKSVNDNVRIKIDGSGSYDDIIPNIKKMIEKRTEGKMYYVRGTFTRANTDFYEDVMAMVNEGFDQVSIEPVVLEKGHALAITEEDLPKIMDNYDKLYEEMLERKRTGKDEFNFYHFNVDLNGGPCVYKRISGCGAGFEYVAITPQGDVYPCHQFVGREEYKLGTIYDDSYNAELGKEFKKAHIYNKPKCRECWARFYCSGGCQANNVSFNGDMNVPYEIGCKMQKKRIECAIALKSE